MEFARMVVDAAYAAGAVNVDVMWQDDRSWKSRFVHGSPEASESVEGRSKLLAASNETGDFLLDFVSTNPGLAEGVDPERMDSFQRVNREYKRDFNEALRGLERNWCGVGVPTPQWAEAVFPDLVGTEALEALWQAIFRVCRVDQDDPVAAWEEHSRQLDTKAELLNEKAYESVRYEGPGTELTLGLATGHIWDAAGAISKQGRHFQPNMPSEEVFTSPHRSKGEGVITVTKPLSISGTIVEGLVLEVSDGTVVKAVADSGQEALDQLLKNNPGADKFGEVALVPQSSLVASENLIWKHGLFDENDASHIAFGAAYPDSIAGAREMTPEQLEAAGLNKSDVHLDFVVGSDHLNVYGVHQDGSEEPLLRDGEWAIDP